MADVGYGIGGYGVWNVPSAGPSTPVNGLFTYRQLSTISGFLENSVTTSVIESGLPGEFSLAVQNLSSAVVTGVDLTVDEGIQQEVVTVLSTNPSVPDFTAVFQNTHGLGVPVIGLPFTSTNEPLWGQGQSNYLVNLPAVAQAVYTRLLLFLGEWWAAINDGLPLFQSILGQAASQRSQQQIASIITARIQATPFVINVGDVLVTFSQSSRAYSYSCSVNTQFGTFTIANFPLPPSGSLS